MKYFVIGVAFIVAGCSVETPPAPQSEHSAIQTDDGPLARQEEQLVTVVATVAAVDGENREITLKSPRGALKTFYVAPEVKRLDEVKVGDRVVTSFYESLAFEVRQPTLNELKNPDQEVVVAGKAGMELPPGMAAASVQKTIVTITGIDLTLGTVTIKLPEGESMTVKAKVPENLKRVQVGDTVAVTYSRAMAVSLEPYQG